MNVTLRPMRREARRAPDEPCCDGAAVRRARAREMGYCQCCGARPAMAGKSVCEKCRESQRKYKRRKLEQCKSWGVCRRCQARPAMPGSQFCEACRARETAYNTAYQRRRRERLRAALHGEQREAKSGQSPERF